MEEKTTSAKLGKPEKNNSEEKDVTILAPLEDYIKTASYLGTKVITPTMRKYIYRRRLDGLAILNTLLVDKKLSDAIDFIKKFKPNEWIVVCKREAGHRAVNIFSEITGVKVFTKKYPAGILTNTALNNFFEIKMILICDPWVDKNALSDAKKIRVPVVGICDTNNHTTNIDVVIIGNNKSNKSLGLFFHLIAREYMKEHNIKNPLPTLEEFVGESLVLEKPKKKKKRKEKELRISESEIEKKMKYLIEKADEEAKQKLKDDQGESIRVSEEVKEGV